MRIAVYARTSAADLGRVTVVEILAELAAYAGRRGWEVVLQCADRGPGLVGRRDGLERLTAAVRGREVDAVLVKSLSQVARSLRHLADLGQLLAQQSIDLVAVAELIDTTDPGGRIRWRDWIEISGGLDHHVRSEAIKVARLRTPDERWGRPVAVVNPLELLSLWEGRGGRRPLSGREIAKKLGVSPATVRKRLCELREAGKVDDGARGVGLAAAGGIRRGGRRGRRLDDLALRAAWREQQQVAQRRNGTPSAWSVSRKLRVSLQRVQERLQELGLLTDSERSPES